MKNKKVLVTGGIGRPHALAWKLAQSPQVEQVFIAPGNGGTDSVATNVALTDKDFEGLADFVTKEGIDLTVIGDDDPLARGIVDHFKEEGLLVFGPTQAAAQIESSKSFAKELMDKASIPTARFRIFNEYDKALAYVEKTSAPIVVKASGLALGKGVFVCNTTEEAKEGLKTLMLDNKFGKSGSTVVIEEMLDGIEFSIHAISDGNKALLFPPSQDHKRAFDGDLGPNTGGMGSYAPVPQVSEELMASVAKLVVDPVIKEMSSEGKSFTGLLYPGVMGTTEGPKVIEYNARFGDPECQTYMRLLESDLYELLSRAAEGDIGDMKLKWYDGYAVTVIAASENYPDSSEAGHIITGLAEAEAIPEVVVFHSGTKQEGSSLQTAGGRVLSVTARGKTLKEARDRAYKALSHISFKGMRYRTDIADKALQSQGQGLRVKD